MTLRLSHITLTYPDGDSRLTALDDVSLDAPPGVTAVIGPSGSGKSSLLAVAATLITPDSGSVVIDGVSTTGLSRRALTELRRTRIGIVFQQPNLIPSLTAAEQLQLMAHLSGHSPRAARQRALDLLDAVGLAPQSDRRPHQLSGGQRQRINIARALMNDPAVLLVDEPTSALDHARGAAIIDLLATLTQERGIATILVTHDPSHLPAATQVATVTDGKLTLPNPPNPADLPEPPNPADLPELPEPSELPEPPELSEPPDLPEHDGPETPPTTLESAPRHAGTPR